MFKGQSKFLQREDIDIERNCGALEEWNMVAYRE